MGVMVISNDPVWPELRLLLSARVKTILSVIPEENLLIHIQRGETWIQELKIISNDGKFFEIKGIESSSKFFTTTYKPINQGKNESPGYELKIKVAPNIPLGRVEDIITIETDVPNASNLKLFLFGKIEGNISYYPDELVFYSHKKVNNGQASNTVHFIQSSGKPLRLEQVNTNNKNIIWGIIPVEQNKSCVLALVWKGKNIDKQINGDLVIVTNDEGMPKISIPYRVIPTSD